MDRIKLFEDMSNEKKIIHVQKMLIKAKAEYLKECDSRLADILDIWDYWAPWLIYRVRELEKDNEELLKELNTKRNSNLMDLMKEQGGD